MSRVPPSPSVAPARLSRRALLGLAVLGLAPGVGWGQEMADPDPRLAEAAAESSLAYVITGDLQVDEGSDLGLAGLTAALRARTTVEPGTPVAVALDEDDLSLLSFLYWPVTEDQPLPSPQAYVRLNRFLRTGGMILFDTRDGDLAGTGAAGGSAALQRLAAALDIPPLAPVPPDHVLTRAFYLLDDFPGRWQGTTVWVEAIEAGAETGALGQSNDGVSPVVIGGNAWAEAWAGDEYGRPLYAIGSGYDADRRREMALRFGINLVMYALSGNYKSDQVHVPELLERLGREQGEATPGLQIPGLLP